MRHVPGAPDSNLIARMLFVRCEKRHAKSVLTAFLPPCIFVIACVYILCAGPTPAQDYAAVKTIKIAVATTAANGQRLSYLATDHPEVTAMIVEIPPGGETGWHLHDVPVYAYVMEGTITIDLGAGKIYQFKKGDAIFEVRATSHNGRNTGRKWARLLVFYTGEEGRSNVTRVEKPAN